MCKEKEYKKAESKVLKAINSLKRGHLCSICGQDFLESYDCVGELEVDGIVVELEDGICEPCSIEVLEQLK